MSTTKEVRVRIEVVIDLNTKYSPEEEREMLERNARRCFPNNSRFFDIIEYRDEKASEWTTIYHPDKQKSSTTTQASI